MQPKVADCTKQTIKTLIRQQFDLGLHDSLQNLNSLLVLYVLHAKLIILHQEL